MYKRQVYDYGQNGVELKNNIKRYWWEAMTRLHPNVVGIDSSIFMHPDIWRASGHVDAFNDPLIDNKDSKKRYRADVLIEDQIAKIEGKAEKEIEKARKRFGDSFDESLYRTTNPRVKGYLEQAEALRQRMAKALNDNDLEELRQIIVDEKIVCPISGTTNWTEVRQFNLMFATEVGSTAEGASTIYLRPETDVYKRQSLGSLFPTDTGADRLATTHADTPIRRYLYGFHLHINGWLLHLRSAL